MTIQTTHRPATDLGYLLHNVKNLISLLSLSGFPKAIWEEAMKTATSKAQARYVALAERQAAESKKA